MAKNDFDIDFDFEEEYGFDPKSILGSDFEDEDLDISGFDVDSLGEDMTEEDKPETGYADFDLDSLELEEEDSEAQIEELEESEDLFEDDFDDLPLLGADDE